MGIFPLEFARAQLDSPVGYSDTGRPQFRLPMIKVTADLPDLIVNDCLRVEIPEVDFAGYQIGYEDICRIEDSLYTTKRYPIWGEGKERDSYEVVGHEILTTSRVWVEEYCVREVWDTCQRWKRESHIYPLTVKVDVYKLFTCGREKADSGEFLYTKNFTVPACPANHLLKSK